MKRLLLLPIFLMLFSSYSYSADKEERKIIESCQFALKKFESYIVTSFRMEDTLESLNDEYKTLESKDDLSKTDEELNKLHNEINKLIKRIEITENSSDFWSKKAAKFGTIVQTCKALGYLE